MLTKEQKSKLRAAYSADVWHSNDHMTDYCVSKTAALAELPDGSFIPVEKRAIEKRFCFGYSLSEHDSESYDAAARAARRAAESADYFKRENMRAFGEILTILHDQQKATHQRQYAVIRLTAYYEQPESSPLKGLSFLRDWEIIDAHGGSCRMDDLPGASFEYRGSSYRVPTDKELSAILAAYEAAAREHEKKIDSYLKRYGMSKVDSWTYWVDA